MTRRLKVYFLFYFLFYSLEAIGCVRPKSELYPICSSSEKLFTETIQLAKREKKSAIFSFGFTGCVWCKSLHDLFLDNNFIKSCPIIKTMVNQDLAIGFNQTVGNQKKWNELVETKAIINRFAKKSGFKVSGYPLLLVVGQDSEHFLFIDTADLEDNRGGKKGHDPNKVCQALLQAESIAASK